MIGPCPHCGRAGEALTEDEIRELARILAQSEDYVRKACAPGQFGDAAKAFRVLKEAFGLKAGM